MSHTDADVLVIGAGFTGAMVAHALAGSGRRVAVVEAARVACGATQLLPCLLMADPDGGEACQRSYEKLAQLAALLAWHTRAVNVTYADSGSADQPRLTTQGDQPALCGDLGWLARALLTRPNISLREGLEISQLQSADGVVCALADGYTLRAPLCVIATGAFSGLLTPEFKQAFDVVRCAAWRSKPINTPVSINTIDAGLPLCIDNGRALIAQDTLGRVHMTMLQSTQSAVDPIEDIHRFLRRYMHEWYDHTEAWQNGVGLRTTTGAPVVVRLSQHPNVIAAINGGCFAPAWAGHVAQAVLGLLP